MTERTKQLLYFIIVVVIFETVVAIIGQIHTREAWGDEIRLYHSILNFADNLNWELIRTYRQMSTPLPFILYAWWGKLFGLELFPLRIFSILIAIATYTLFFRLLYDSFGKKLAWLAGLFLIGHPYNVGLSIFVFFDTMTLLFLLIAYWSVLKDKPIILSIALASAVLCRQYMLFFVVGIGLYFLLKWLFEKDKRAVSGLIATVLSTLPYLALMIFWGGASPDNEYRAMYLTDGYLYDLTKLTLYLSILSMFTLPFLIWKWKSFYGSYKTVVLSLVLGLIYFLFPIAPSKYSVEIGVHTVGLFHKGLVWMFGSDTIIQMVFYLFFSLSLPVIWKLLKQLYQGIKQKQFSHKHLLGSIIILFFITMPFSYLGWEKYFMPLVPFLLLWMINENNKEPMSP